MKRSVEAFTSMYTALFHLYIEQIMQENPILEKEIREALIEAVNNIENFRSKEPSQLIANHNLLLGFMDSRNFPEGYWKVPQKIYENGGKSSLVHSSFT